MHNQSTKWFKFIVKKLFILIKQKEQQKNMCETSLLLIVSIKVLESKCSENLVLF